MTESHVIGAKHYRAICDEIGARLAQMLRPDHSDLPPKIAELMKRLQRLDGDAPSIVPSLEEMLPLQREPARDRWMRQGVQKLR